MRRAAAAVLLISGLSVLLGCEGSPTSHDSISYKISPSHVGHPVPIGRGRIGANDWTLSADLDGNGELCLGVSWFPASFDPASPGCGFGSRRLDTPWLDTSPTSTATADDGSILIYGPSPAGAARLRLTITGAQPADCPAADRRPLDATITHRVPAWYRNPGAGWFATPVQRATATCVYDAIFYDRNGHAVTQPRNF